MAFDNLFVALGREPTSLLLLVLLGALACFVRWNMSAERDLP